MMNPRLGAIFGLAGLAGAGVAAAPEPAQAWWRYGFGVIGPPVVVVPPPYYAPPPAYYPPPPAYYPPPTAYYPPPPAYYAPPPAVYAPPRRVWVPPHWEGSYWVPGRWS